MQTLILAHFGAKLWIFIRIAQEILFGTNWRIWRKSGSPACVDFLENLKIVASIHPSTPYRHTVCEMPYFSVALYAFDQREDEHTMMSLYEECLSHFGQRRNNFFISTLLSWGF